jgi:hypothetical protein
MVFPTLTQPILSSFLFAHVPICSAWQVILPEIGLGINIRLCFIALNLLPFRPCPPGMAWQTGID